MNENFYFNGELMPSGAQAWHWAGLLPLARKEMQEWDEAIGSQDLWLLATRIDHSGVIESEDVRVFELSLQTLLLILIRKKSLLLRRLKNQGPHSLNPEEQWSALFSGALRMLHRVRSDGLAVWTCGSEIDRLKLVEFLHRHRLPLKHPDHLELPHIQQRHDEYLRRRQWMEAELHSCFTAGWKPECLLPKGDLQ